MAGSSLYKRGCDFTSIFNFINIFIISFENIFNVNLQFTLLYKRMFFVQLFLKRVMYTHEKACANNQFFTLIKLYSVIKRFFFIPVLNQLKD